MDGLVFETTNHCLEQVHIHKPRYEVFFCELGEDFHYFNSAEGGLVVESFEEKLKELLFSLGINLLSGQLLFCVRASLQTILRLENVDDGVREDLNQTDSEEVGFTVEES